MHEDKDFIRCIEAKKFRDKEEEIRLDRFYYPTRNFRWPKFLITILERVYRMVERLDAMEEARERAPRKIRKHE